MTIQIIRRASLGLSPGAIRTLPAATEAALVLDGEAIYYTAPPDGSSSGLTTAQAAAVAATTRTSYVPETYGAVHDSVTDDTTAIQAAIDAASAAYNATTGERAGVYFGPYIYGMNGFLLKSNVVYNFGQARFKKVSNSGSLTGNAQNSMIRTLDQFNTSTWYGNADNIDIFGGTFDPNGFACAAQILRFENVRRFKIRDTRVIHHASVQSWAFQIGGQDIEHYNLRVEGGTLVFQDGLHITHGDNIRGFGGYFAAGDDALAFGTDYTGSETWDDEALTSVTHTAPHVYTSNGTIKFYYGLNSGIANGPFNGSLRGRIDGVVVSQASGTLGRFSNGAIYVQDTSRIVFTAAFAGSEASGTLTSVFTGTTGTYDLVFTNGNMRSATMTNGSAAVTFSSALSAVAALATVGCIDKTRIKNIQVTDCDLTSGSSASDGVNATGIYVRGATNLKVSGTIRPIDTVSGSRASVCNIGLLDGGDFQLKVPLLPPTGPGLQFFNSADIDIHNGSYFGGAGSGRGSIEITGTQDVRIKGNTFKGIPSNGTVVLVQGVGSGLLANTLLIEGNFATKASGAATTRFYNQQSSAAGFVTCLQITNNDMRGQSNSTAIDQMFNGTGVTPDLMIVHNNRGASVASTPYPVTSGAAVTIPAVTGQRLNFTALTTNMVLTAPGLGGMPIGFTIDMTFLQDATAGRTITWPATFKFYSAAWVDAVVTTDASKSTAIRAVFDGTNFIVQAPNRWA